jgi:hypothetical protein
MDSEKMWSLLLIAAPPGLLFEPAVTFGNVNETSSFVESIQLMV